MNMRRWMMAGAAVAFVLPVQAKPRQGGTAQPVPLAATDPLVAIYRASGVSDTGSGVQLGVATAFPCTSSSTVAEKLRNIVRAPNGTVIADKTYSIAGRQTFTASTHFTAFFTEEDSLSAGVIIDQGTVTIQAATTNITCSAMIVDAANLPPTFAVALHLQRFNPLSGTQE